MSDTDAIQALRESGPARHGRLAVASADGAGAVLVGDGVDVSIAPQDLAETISDIDELFAPRWVVWSRDESERLRQHGALLSAAWDLAAVHRLTVGGWRAEPSRIWAHHRGLAPDTIPETGVDGALLDLFTDADRSAGDPDDPVRADGHLRPEWGTTSWRPTRRQLSRWANLALDLADTQLSERRNLAGRARAELVARSESTTELLCNELSAAGLPLDRSEAVRLITELAGPPPASEAEAAAQRRVRDTEVLRHVPGAGDVDLRSPGQVKSLLRRAGIEVEDTRAWRLEPLVGTHPVIEALLRWRKAERVATTFGYAWLDQHLGDDGRLRGTWTGCDGAAGRMTASAGLHNLTSDLRPAVVAEHGHVFVRSDLGQIEPRVLAAVSGDERLAVASRADDLYADVAATLGAEREIAKVAVLGAMYGQTTGRGAQALVELRRAYPVAMEYLDIADLDARRGIDVTTYGGRLVRMDARGDAELPEPAARRRAAARGRYGRNAVIQGAAAELFKMWAVTVRARSREIGAEIVLCLHDELLVHAPSTHAEAAAAIVDDALQEAVHRWAPAPGAVRFLSDTSLVSRWSDAKG